MAIIINTNQTFDAEGNLISETIVETYSYPSEVESLAVAARLAAFRDIEVMTYSTIEELSGIFLDWAPGLTVVADEVYRHLGLMYRVVQSHTTQENWAPDVTPALFTVYYDATAETPPAWIQPTGAHDAYHIGNRVTHEGSTWVCVVDNNTWEPGVYGWDQE